MKNGSRMTLILVCLAWAFFGCSPTPPTQTPAVNRATQAPGTLPATSVLENPANTAAAPVIETPVDSDLNALQILDIVRSSLSAYPWRLEQSVLSKATGQTITSLTEAQSSTKGYNKSVQLIGTETVTIESMLIDPKFYLKMTGSPAATYGLVDGQWAEVLPDSPLAQLVDMGVIDPARVAETFAADMVAVSGGSSLDQMLFTAVGSEDVNGILTTIYESKGATYTYRWWIGSDQRFHKSTVDIPEATRTILVDYNLSINIQPPIP